MQLLPSLPKMIQTMDRLMMPEAEALILRPVWLDVEADVAIADMDIEEARQIMAEIDAKSSALLAVLAIILAASTFIFSLDQTWLTLSLMFAQVVTVSVSILFLLRCLIYEPSPRLHRIFEMERVSSEHSMQIEAIKQVRYFNRVIVLTVLTSILFFAMSMLVGVDAMIRADG